MRLKPFVFATILSIVFAIAANLFNVSNDTLFVVEGLIWSSYFIASRCQSDF